MTKFLISLFVPPFTLLSIYAFVFMSLWRKEKRDEQLKRTYTKLYGGWMHDINGNIVPEYIPNPMGLKEIRKNETCTGSRRKQTILHQGIYPRIQHRSEDPV